MNRPRRRYRVSWAAGARQDLREIGSYVALDSPRRARLLGTRLRSASEALVRFPDRGRVPPELADLGIVSHREIIVSPYRLLYRVLEDTVRIIAVLDGRRDIQRLYLERIARTGA